MWRENDKRMNWARAESLRSRYRRKQVCCFCCCCQRARRELGKHQAEVQQGELHTEVGIVDGGRLILVYWLRQLPWQQPSWQRKTGAGTGDQMPDAPPSSPPPPICASHIVEAFHCRVLTCMQLHRTDFLLHCSVGFHPILHFQK